MRILLVDDDELLIQTLVSHLTSQHYVVDVAKDGEAGWDYTRSAAYDLIVLDINLPKLDGIQLCQKLRQARCTVPILLLTALGSSADKVIGLDAGADDYLVKPCTTEELSARIRALTRRYNPSTSPILEWGDLVLDPGTCEVTYQGQRLALSPKEYGLLELFLRNPQRVFSSSILLEHLWGFDAPGEETIRTHIKRLRRKLKSAGIEDMIDTVYGMGYRLKPPVERDTPIPQQSSTTDQARAAAIALWEQFKPSILERVATLEQAVEALTAGNLPEELGRAATAAAHKLAGSLGMFGFPAGTQLGQEIERWFQAAGTESVEQLQSLVTKLQQTLQHPPQLSDDDLLISLSQESTDSRTVSEQPSLADQPPASTCITGRQAQNLPSLPIKVLAVDDDPLVLETLRQFLPHWGIEISTLSDPLQLWDVLATEMPDLLILDVDMPQVSGIELCRAIRNESAWSGLPILFLTAYRNPEIVLQMYSAGADDYVSKPFIEPEIVTRIFNRLERNRLLRTWQKPG
ncbi:response regulator [Leptothermofonsia sichuanensis E412]|uniref:response regulator n=1 Tax=Leptothermofonsia sichuanensis TaxID=2917832 RepID=UPI001CA6C7D9|nr:response regulator [Leptothermofonsia sichuanensis]QZZ19584.1 response regulator [Leptothermofonsia sichuanensis E412]